MKYTLQVDLVVGDISGDDGGKGGNVVSSEGFTEDVEIVVGQAWVKLEESDEENLEISSSVHGIVRVLVSGNRITNTDRAVDEEEVELVIPGDGFEGGS